MPSLRALAAAIVAVAATSTPSPLQVLSFSPGPEASLTPSIQVIFDRPVAGSLDRTVDPNQLIRIEPTIPGHAAWRDPVTLQFLPDGPLTPGTGYRVVIADDFAAMDGSRLAGPFEYRFTVTGPRLLAGLPVSQGERPRFLTPATTFELVFSAPLERSAWGGLAYLDFDPTCRDPGIIKLTAVSQRAIVEQDPWQYREAGGWDRDRSGDRYRRVVSLTPERPLPLGCSGSLVAPSVVDPAGTSPFVRWPFSTYGSFRLGGAVCVGSGSCPTGGVQVRFTTPVRGSEVLRHLTLLPATTFTVDDSTRETDVWYLETTLSPRTGYAVIADSSLRDVFGQRLDGNPAAGFRTTGYAPMVEHEYGRLTIERDGFRTLAVKYVNVDSLAVTIAPVPDSLVPAMLRYSSWSRDDSALAHVLRGATTRTVAVTGAADRVRIYGAKLPVFNAARPGAPLLQLVRVTSPTLPEAWRKAQPYAVVQVTDLAVHAKVGLHEAAVWVTGVHDGAPRSGAAVTLFDASGSRVASGRTGPDGVVRLTNLRPDTARAEYGFEGYVVARLGNDQGLTGISSYDPDLSPWEFNVQGAFGSGRRPVAAAVFTERGIYRPGETVHAKAIVRAGLLGRLAPPPTADSLRWIFQARDGGTLTDSVRAPSSFGTGDASLTLPPDLPLGSYTVSLRQKLGGQWVDVANAGYRVAEYRPPEFLVNLSADSAPRLPGDSVTARVEARYLFGAPMARANLSWVVRQTPMDLWELAIPNTDGFFFGESGAWWEEGESSGPGTRVVAQGSDTLDPSGRLTLTLPLAAPEGGRPSRATIEASVTDVNRQVVGSRATVVVHPAAFYLGAKPSGKSYFWTAGQPQSVGVIAVRPDGTRIPGVAVRGTLVRREWHQVHRSRAGYSEVYGEWVSDTVGGCRLTTATMPADCRVTPTGGGSYVITFRAEDPAGRAVVTSVYRWVTGSDWVPWNDESQFKMDLIPDRTRYSPGDTATILFASPFTNAEAWVTVEREGLIEQRRLRLTSGSTTLKFPVTEAWAPNAYVSVLVARGRSAPPGPLDDPGRPTIRVGYTALSVTPEVKRLDVEVQPLQPEYRPGDTARVRLTVRDAGGRGRRSEVTLWAVDEGVLALTGYHTPDPVALLYAPRGLGLRLASNLTTVAPQVPEGEKGGRSPGGGGGQGGSDVLRSRFQTTAFFLGSVVTDPTGHAVAAARLPDNLTTFRVMAVAVTAGDRYGSGHSSLLVTRPLLARPALPRFVREADRFTAGVVVNQRAGGTPEVTVTAAADGSRLSGPSTRRATLEPGRGREVRFEFQQPGADPLGGDSVSFRFRVTGEGDEDAVLRRLPVKPAFRPRAWTVAGVLGDTATARFQLPEGLDPERSRLRLTLGTSPLSAIRGLGYALRVYPYGCSEQVSSAAAPIIALYRAQQARPGTVLIPGRPREEIATAVGILSRRQRPDGGIGFWSATDWTTPWLSAYAGTALLDARDAGIPVSDTVLARLAGYLRQALTRPAPVRAPVIGWYHAVQARLSDLVAAADFLSRYGKPEIAAENELLRTAPQLAWEDRLRLAVMLSRRQAMDAARSLVQPAWDSVRVEGNRAIVPAVAVRWHHYFDSRTRPVARLLIATLAVDSTNRLIGPLIQTLVQQGRAGVLSPWNTQDYAAAVGALAAVDRRFRAGARRSFTVASGRRTILSRSPASTAGSGGSPAPMIADSTVPLTGLLADAAGGHQALRLDLRATTPGPPIYYYLTVTEVPRERPVNPEAVGIRLERWYEKYDRPTPIVTATEGDLVRVRLRITVPAEREFVVVEDALPAGLEPVDLSLRTASLAPGPGGDQGNPYLTPEQAEGEQQQGASEERPWYYGSWDSGWWSPFDHRELGDSRVVYSATVLWSGTYTMTYLARATTPGTFVRPPAHAEEMYNPAVYGRSDGGVFTVKQR